MDWRSTMKAMMWHAGCRNEAWLLLCLKYRVIHTSDSPEEYAQQMKATRAMPFEENESHLEAVTRSVRPMAIADGLQAVKTVRSRATEWGVDPSRIGIMGFSAGGHIAAYVSLLYDAASRPDFAAVVYGALIKDVQATPGCSAFIHGIDKQRRDRRDPQPGAIYSLEACPGTRSNCISIPAATTDSVCFPEVCPRMPGSSASGNGSSWKKRIDHMLKISENKRFLIRQDGSPFFYLADTAWFIFQRLDEDEVGYYLRDRAEKGFTVIQAVAISEFDGLHLPNRYGHLPLNNCDPTKPVEAYFHFMDVVIEKAASLGLVVGLLPTWGDKVGPVRWGVGPEIFTPENAFTYGEYLGTRYRDHPIIWILGGDRNPDNEYRRPSGGRWHTVSSVVIPGAI